MKLSNIVAAFSPVLAILIVILAFWGHDVWEDHRHIVSVLGDTPIYLGSGDEACGGVKLAIAHNGTKLAVRRIRYWKNCATLDITLPDGRHGYIIAGDGNVSVAPPLGD
jgi:hypothetical protein